MKRETIQRRIGIDGKYGGLFKRIKRTWASEEYGAENAIREFFSASRPTIAETIDQREKLALAIIEAEGYEIQEPYRFNAGLIGKIETDIRDEILKKMGLLDPSRAEKSRAKAEGSLTPLGRAAQILKECHNLRQSMEDGNVEGTAHNAMLLQNSINELWFSEYELAAFVGGPIVGNRNAEKHTDEDKQQWRNRYDELKLEIPRLKKRRASEIIATEISEHSETGPTTETVRKELNKIAS